MTFFDWTPDLSVGHEKMDAQHQSLIETINEFYQLLDADADKQAILTCLAKVTDYTTYHFADEEALMEQINYPDLKRHREIHQQLVVKLSDLIDEIKHDAPDAYSNTKYFLKLWLSSHIKGIDSDYGKYV